MNLSDLTARTARIEAIMKDHGLHEPGCPQRGVERSNARGGAYFLPQPCECWLVDEAGK